ncbi:MAG: hypothetical protein B7X95_03135 [Methylophilaceae bacterium 17-44-8]|nr:MAG: hypothetical protein B7Y48_01015 [Methylophilales bacterium 28-44-11]OZA06373.1 MAG: hypothetical protein B7X95_03135 [Methylophilaceae bacterium 17-44-8]
MITLTDTTETDVAIVGAGLVGLTAAIALAKQGRHVTLIDSHAKPAHTWLPTIQQWDARIYALTEETIAWLTSLGIWQYVDIARVEPIQSMTLREPSQSAPLILKSEDAYLPQMGCILESANLMHACYQMLEAIDIQLTVASPVSIIQHAYFAEIKLDTQENVHAKLIVAADGVQSWVRQTLQIGVTFKSFHQTAIVANFNVEHAHEGDAQQWFLPHETLALLPLPSQMVSMVWALSTERAQAMLGMSEDMFTQEVEAACHQALGQLTLCGETMSFSLNQQTAHSIIAERVVLVGDAAHQVHPMAGQGVNLGFRDVMALTQLTAKLSVLQDVGDFHFLRQYARARKLDVVKMTTLTSGLDALFSTSYPWLQHLTGWGMQQINRTVWLKKQLVQTATL